jgi:hypothetical protein
MTTSLAEIGTVNKTEPRRKAKPLLVIEQLNVHARRRFELVPKETLIIPTDLYQRDNVDSKIAKDIALYYDAVAFGVLTVIRRQNGEMHVADGGTRLSAAMMRVDISTVPCIVFEGLADKEAAQTFLRINLTRRKLNTHEQQHGEFYAGKELAIMADRTIRDFASNRIGFDSLNVLRSGLRQHHAETLTIIKIILSIAADKYLTARVFKGLIWLETELQKHDMTIDKRNLIRKLREDFGQLDTYISGAIPQRSGGDKKICGQAIARRLHVKIPRG